jgi:hypothetical protein
MNVARFLAFQFAALAIFGLGVLLGLAIAGVVSWGVWLPLFVGVLISAALLSGNEDGH